MDLIRTSLREFSEDRCMQMAAALAFYMMLSLAPFLVVVVTIASFFVGPQAQDVFARQAGNVIGSRSADELQQILDRGQEETSSETTGSDRASSKATDSLHDRQKKVFTRESVTTIVTNVISIVVLIFSATGIFVQLQASLNHVWEVEPDKKSSGTVEFLKKRIMSFGMILAITLLLLASMLLTTILSAAEQWVSENLGVGRFAAFAVNELTSFLLVTILFASVFKVLPDAKVPWRVTWGGALMTALLFALGKFVIGIYLGSKDMSTAYGQAGSFVLLLLWIYYSAIIFFLGAELTQVWARRHGYVIEPSDGAVRVVVRRQHVHAASEET